jgi:hypothetical protein
LSRDPHHKRNVTKISQEAALAEFDRLTGMQLTLEQVRNPRSHLRRVSGEERRVLGYLIRYEKNYAAQQELREQYRRSEEFGRRLEPVLEFLVEAREMHVDKLATIAAAMRYPENEGRSIPWIPASEYFRQTHRLLAGMRKYNEELRESLSGTLVKRGLESNESLYKLISDLLTVRVKGAMASVGEDVLFKEVPVFGLVKVPPFVDEEFSASGLNVRDCIGKVVEQRVQQNLRYQSFLTYRQVALLFVATGHYEPGIGSLQDVGDAGAKYVGRCWGKYVKDTILKSALPPKG